MPSCLSSRRTRPGRITFVLVVIAIIATRAAWEPPLVRALPDRPLTWLGSHLERDAVLQLERGRRARAAGRLVEAASSLEAAANLAANDPEAQALSALALADVGAFTLAEAAYRRAHQLSADHPLVRVYEARRALETAGPPEALRITQSLVAERPEVAEGWYVRAQAFFRIHNTREALNAIRAAVRLDPRNGAYHRELAQVHQAVGALAEAEAAASQALRLSPHDPLTHLVLGRILVDRDTSAETLERAAAELEFAVRRVRTNADRHLALRELGRVRARQGRWTPAQAALERASELDPRDPGTLYHLSIAYRMNSDPRHPELLARFRQLEASGREERFLRGAIKESPRNLEPRQRLASIYERDGRFREAEEVMSDFRPQPSVAHSHPHAVFEAGGGGENRRH